MSLFWTIFWADAFWNLVWLVGITVPVGIGVAVWRKRKLAARKEAPKESIRRVVLVLDADPPPAGKCPLCGQGWPLSGPVYPDKHDAP
jgi:hypothetical protein